MRVKIKTCPNSKDLPALPTIWASSDKATPGVMLEPVEADSDELYETITLLCGAAVGIFFFFMIMIYVVYSSFKVKTEKQSSAGGSPEFERKPSRIARWRRGSGQSSRASIRTIN